MKFKKFIAAPLIFALLTSSISQSAMAAGSCKKEVQAGYSGVNILLDQHVEASIPTLKGIPEHSDSMDVFYSDKGFVKLKVNDAKLFGNGAKVEVRLTERPKPTWKLNFFNCKWDELGSFSPPTANDINRLSIKGPEIKRGFSIESLKKVWTMCPYQVRAALSVVPAYISYELANKAYSFVRTALSSQKLLKMFAVSSQNSFKMSVVFAALWVLPFISAFSTWISWTIDKEDILLSSIKKIFKPVTNFVNSMSSTSKPQNVEFKYGVVLTDKDDEKALSNDPPPKEGDLDPDYAMSEEQHKKAKQILKEKLSKINDGKDSGFRPMYPKYYDSDVVLLTKEKAQKIADDRKVAKAKAIQKLAEAKPITEGLVCVLNTNNPEQTFRLVMNSNLGGHDSDLFSIALNAGAVFAPQNDNISFTVTHVVSTSAGAEALRSRVGNIADIAVISEAERELRDKVVAIDKKRPSAIDDVVSWFDKTWKTFFGSASAPPPPSSPPASGSGVPLRTIVDQDGDQWTSFGTEGTKRKQD